MKLAHSIFIFAMLTGISMGLSSCSIKNPLGPKTQAYVAVINDSVELLNVDVDGVRESRRDPLSAGRQLDHLLILDVSVNHVVVWTLPDGKIYRSQNYSPDNIFRERKDLYGNVVDGVIRASGRNLRMAEPAPPPDR